SPTSEETIQEHVQVLRKSFNAGKLKSLSARKTQLKQLRLILTEGQEILQAAIWKDLHKHSTETFVAEVGLCLAEIQDHLDYMDDWAAPQKVSTNLLNIPGSSYVRSDPLGVCCIMDTWNYPIQLLVLPLIGCLSAGNCALLRLPAEGTSDNVAAALAYLFDKYMDSDVVRYVAGGINANIAMLKQKFDLIFCTGGCTIGKIVARAAAETLTPVILELGGKSPAIIDSSIDVIVSARRLIWGGFSNCGQTCVRPDYIFVHESIGPALVKALKQAILDFFGENPQQCDSYGRLVNSAQFERMQRLYDADKDFAIIGGQSDQTDRYFAPTLFNYELNYDAFVSSAVMEGELFGPLLPICYYKDIHQALDYVNSHPKPLSLYVFSSSSSIQELVLSNTTSGSACVNDTLVHLTNPHLPFGGVGNSGMGAYHGHHSFKAFSHQKSVMYKPFILDIAQRYQPYTSFAEKLLRFALRPIPRSWIRVLYGTGFLSFIGIILAIIFASKHH
ncbi:aldehyde dehydrogenase, partial [Thraustotheca clavata]